MTDPKQYLVVVEGDGFKNTDARLCGTHFFQWLCSVPSTKIYSFGQVDVDIQTVTGEACDLCTLGDRTGLHLKPSPFLHDS